ncbi:hypothetical protein P7C71_g457, partial [Lecanoromycetidae sp. Uapishka_2]
MSLPSSLSRFSTRRGKSITESKAKPIDVGNPIGVYDTNSVRDRVRHWQAQGGGVVHADDVGGGEDEQPELSVLKSRTPKKEPRTPSNIDAAPCENVAPSRSGRRTSKVEEEAERRSRSGSAPAKRIVSDAHWRKKRSPPKSTTSPRAAKSVAPTRTLPDDGISVEPTQDSKSGKRSIRETKIRTPKRESAGDDDGIRVYASPPGSQRHSERSRRQSKSEYSVSERGSGSELEAPTASRRLTQATGRRQRPTPEKSLHTSPSNTKESFARRKSSAQKTLDLDDSSPSAKGAPSDGRGSIRSHKGGILSHVFGDSRKRLAKQAPEVIPATRVPSIEAWLNDTSDPFIDSEEPAVEIVEPLRPLAEKRKIIPQEVPVADPNRIWDAVGTKEGTRRAVTGSRRKKRIPSSAIYEENPFPADFDSDSALSGSGRGTESASKFVDLVQNAPEPLPSSLKRRSARKSISSPIRERRKPDAARGTDQDEDNASALSSNITTSSVEGPDPSYPMKPPGLNIRRPFPSTGTHHLSTIASVETFNTQLGAVPPSRSELSERTIQHPGIEDDVAALESRDKFDPNSLKRSNSRLTKHADLISVLSLPRAGNKSIQSARSIRTNRSRLATATIKDLLQELATDESKYMRELRTLVDGVIPVLLTCVLSKSDSAVAAGLFQPSGHGHDDPNFTRPIVDMGIALERLKKLHQRIPQADPDALLTWAHGAQRVYTEYLKAWRMGFNDVVVNLAPAAENAQSLDDGLPRNMNGDVVTGDGERVDVAFLLKRPLVRLKYLQKTLKGINFIKPSAEAESLAMKYQNLVEDARRRSNEERARLEDEAASNIDPTRARDPRSLAPLTGVTIDRTRRVRARDHFSLALQHSSGQRVDCRVELLLRDEAASATEGGDLLICEVDGTGRWLLFPPVQYGRVSARNGDLKGEIVLMIRGIGGTGSEWQELFSLRSEDEQAGFEWVQMLSLTPVPPRISRSQSFLSKRQGRKSISAPASAVSSHEPATAPSSPGKSRTPSPREVEIPIGEQALNGSKTWGEPTSSKPAASPPTAPLRQPRRSSSPLKHEYEPSTASESSSDSDASTVERRHATSVSDSSDDEELEDGDAPTPLMPLGTLKRFSNARVSPRTSAQPTLAGTIKPSESASQAPYKTVPAQPSKATKTIASIFSWSDTGSWQSLHPDECSIVITPGLIEAYEMSAAHSKFVPPSSSTPVTDADAFSDMASNLTSQNDEVQGDRPLVALELTPLVPLRRGTALDISIRSPPTSQSQIISGNNMMFRSRNPEECEALYALINHARINNPTFIALQNARASGSSFGADRRASISATGSRRSWFGGFGRSSSYRASSAPTPSIAPSESSIGSMSSAFSALKRFGRGSSSGMFNISRSTIISREGSRANSIYTSSDNSSGSGTSSPVPPGMISAGKDAPIGLSNAKIRLYIRETASRWRDMGSAKLTIMRPEKSDIGIEGRPNSSGGHSGGNEKRIVIHGKTKGEVLLDVQLKESCFERVARTGIALSVWQEVVGPNGEVGIVNAQGGVMKSEAETAYTFSIVGKLRY